MQKINKIIVLFSIIYINLEQKRVLLHIIIHKPNIIYNFAPHNLNTSTSQHLNTSPS